eukprot:scaffold10.g2232.t1
MDDAGLEGYEDWQLVGDAYFSKREVYQLGWAGGGVDLAFMRVYPAPFGGPVAASRDDNKVLLFKGAFAKPDVQLFTAAGRPLGRVLWDKGRIVEAGWTSAEELVTVDDRGQVHMFNVRGEKLPQRFSLGPECESEGVEEAVVFRDGLLAVTPSRHLWCVASLAEPRLQRLPRCCPPGSALHCLAVLMPAVSPSGTLEVLAAVDNTVWVLDANEASPTPVFEGPILRLATSPCGKFVAGYGQDATIHIWAAGLTGKKHVVTRVGLAETEADLVDNLGAEAAPDTLPDRLLWCGSDGVVAYWEGSGALLVTLDGCWRWWDLGAGGAAALVTEVDGLRVLTNTASHLLRKVPPPLASALEIGSTSPGALLYDARRLYDAQASWPAPRQAQAKAKWGRDARATAELLEILRSGDLPSAVSTCLAAAAAELNPKKQAALLRASCYGHAFLVGIPLTMRQLEAEGLQAVVARLVGRRLYLLAYRICEPLGLSPEQVLVSWACDKISAAASSVADQELLAALQAKLKGQPGVKYATVAAHAQAVGRRHLAALLLEHETAAGEQVPLLLELGEDERALEKAVESGDSDLLFQVVHAMWRQLERSASSATSVAPAHERFWAGVARRPSALAFFTRFHQEKNPALLLELYEAAGQQAAAADFHFRAALDLAGAGAPESQVQRELTQARDAHLRAPAEAKGRDHKWEAAAVAQHLAGRVDRRSGVTMEHFVAVARTAGAPRNVLRWFIDRLSGDNALARKAQLYRELGMATEAGLLEEQAAEAAAAGGGVLGSLRGAHCGGGGRRSFAADAGGGCETGSEGSSSAPSSQRQQQQQHLEAADTPHAAAAPSELDDEVGEPIDLDAALEEWGHAMDEGDWEAAWSVFEAAVPVDGEEFPTLLELQARLRGAASGGDWSDGAALSRGGGAVVGGSAACECGRAGLRCCSRPVRCAPPPQEWDPESEEKAARRQREMEKQAGGCPARCRTHCWPLLARCRLAAGLHAARETHRRPPLGSAARATCRDAPPPRRAPHPRPLQAQQAARWVRKVDDQGRSHAAGKRKTSIARVWLRPGAGHIMVNKRPFDAYFPGLIRRNDVIAPFEVTGSLGLFDVMIRVRGGGVMGQAQAVRHGIARALQAYDPALRPALKAAGLLTRDARKVERKKPGREKARKAFQWVKR